MSFLRSLMTATRPYVMSPDEPAAPAAAPSGGEPAAPAAAPAPPDSPAPAAPAAAPAAPGASPEPAASASPPAAAAAAPPAPPATAASGSAPAAAASPAAAADWPSDWREKLAGDDKGFLNTLKRYASPLDAGRWIRDVQLKISAGELRPPKAELPKDATPEQTAAWRKEQGLPEKPADFLTNLKLSDGIVPGEADKPLLNGVAQMAFDRGYDQKSVNDFVGLYYDLQQNLANERVQLDNDNRVETQQKLVQEMGADFKPNMNALKVFWNDKPPEVQEMLLGARTADGRVVGDIPEVVTFLAGLARELNPASAVLPAGGASDAKAVVTRKSEIEGQMYTNGKPNPAYWQNEALQKEYRDLIDAEIKMNERAA